VRNIKLFSRGARASKTPLSVFPLYASPQRRSIWPYPHNHMAYQCVYGRVRKTHIIFRGGTVDDITQKQNSQRTYNRKLLPRRWWRHRRRPELSRVTLNTHRRDVQRHVTIRDRKIFKHNNNIIVEVPVYPLHAGAPLAPPHSLSYPHSHPHTRSLTLAVIYTPTT